MGLINFSNIQDGTTIDANDVNGPFNTIYDEFNGNITNANIASNAAIAGTKLADDAITASKIDWASTGANGGIWWEELGRTTLSSAGDTISVTGLPVRKYLKVFVYYGSTGGNTNGLLRFNNDSGSNYAFRVTTNGAADIASASQTSIQTMDAGADNGTKLASFEIYNVATLEKIVTSELVGSGSAGAGNTPSRRIGVGKWANTTDAITRIDIVNGSTGDYAIGSEIVVLGHN